MKEKVNIIVFTQNLILDSIAQIVNMINKKYAVLFVSSHRLFENEEEYLEKIFSSCKYYTFSSFLSDLDMQLCDEEAFKEEKNNILDYYQTIKEKKNQIVISRLLDNYEPISKYILSDDLGIDENSWLNAGFIKLNFKYYYNQDEKTIQKQSFIGRIKDNMSKSIYSAHFNGTKYVFYGSMNRIGYRVSIRFKKDKIENLLYYSAKFLRKIIGKVPFCRKNVEHISTLHEHSKWFFPSDNNYKISIIQDGYLPPNYSSQYLKFITSNTKYYAWDTLGMQVFKNQGIPIQLLPFRKKLYMPKAIFNPIKTVLCVASGAGDWTALKNRSDEDAMIITFAKIAKKYPDILFVYRCHPSWVHPSHQGVNSINRVATYFSWLKLPNLILSGNIPSTNISNFELSFSRNSLDEDLRKADFVFGEHSISMIDAAFKGIPFASVNITGRRDFFCGMSELGFPHCETIEEIEDILNDEHRNEDFMKKYNDAIDRYNCMTDEE